MLPLGQRHQPSATGRGTTFSCLNGAIFRLVRLSRESRDSRAPSLKSRDEGTHAPRGQRRPCVSDVRGLVCLLSGSATPAVSDGTGDKASYSSFQRYYRFCLDNTDKAAPLSRCATQGPDLRTSSWSATRGTTSLADFPVCAKSPRLEP